MTWIYNRHKEEAGWSVLGSLLSCPSPLHIPLAQSPLSVNYLNRKTKVKIQDTNLFRLELNAAFLAAPEMGRPDSATQHTQHLASLGRTELKGRDSQMLPRRGSQVSQILQIGPPLY